jgi:hypothetical protein
MVTADKLILKWGILLASFNDLWEIETQAKMITWSTNGGRSPLVGTKMPGPTAAFEHVIQPDGSLLAEQQWKERQQSSWPCKLFNLRQT